MEFLGRLAGAALLAATFSVLGTIALYVIDDPCRGPAPGDSCGYAYLAAPFFALAGFFLLFPVWAVSLNAKITLPWRLASGLIVTAVVIGLGLALFVST